MTPGLERTVEDMIADLLLWTDDFTAPQTAAFEAELRELLAAQREAVLEKCKQKCCDVADGFPLNRRPGAKACYDAIKALAEAVGGTEQ